MGIFNNVFMLLYRGQFYYIHPESFMLIVYFYDYVTHSEILVSTPFGPFTTALRPKFSGLYHTFVSC